MNLLLLFAAFSFASCIDDNDFKKTNNDQELDDFVQSAPLNVLVFVDKQLCVEQNDNKCQQQFQQLEEIQYLCARENIQLSLSTNLTLAEKHFNIYGTLPKLCFFRNGFPIIYPGLTLDVGNVQEWLADTRQKLTHVLDDSTFEHDTQASTGATTGVWFILFKNENGCRSLVPLWEAASLHFRNRVIFAYVDVNKSPTIKKRFHLFNIPTLILFKLGKMYRYESTAWTQSAFTDFTESGYTNVKPETVPSEPSSFALLFENVTAIIPIYLIVIPVACLVVLRLVHISNFSGRMRTPIGRSPLQIKVD